MACVNKWIGVGNVCKPPETRFAPSGDAICNITVACNDSYKDKTTGEKKETTEFVRVVFFGKLAEVVDKYVTSGRQIYVEGSMRTRKWTDKNGQDRYTTEIRGDVMQMLGGRPEDGGAQPAERQAQARQPARQEAAAEPQEDWDSDIPF